MKKLDRVKVVESGEEGFIWTEPSKTDRVGVKLISEIEKANGNLDEAVQSFFAASKLEVIE